MMRARPFAPPPEPPLPTERVNVSRPFEHCGIDYFGPYRLKSFEEKCYGLIFSCMTTRAIHLEMTSSLSADKTMLAMRRFISRRGCPGSILSDNAKQFQLVKSTVEQQWQMLTYDEKLSNFVTSRGIKWVHTTERAPWRGSIYERLIGSVKYCLKRTLGRRSFEREELYTILIEVELIVNSRPLTTQTENEITSVLKPIDFLLPQGSGLIVNETSDIDPDDPDFLLTRDKEAAELIRLHKSAAHRIELFWECWLTEYLTSLREKWRGSEKPKIAPRIGQVVIVQEDETPKSCWKIARIIELISERTAVIKMCPGGHITRRATQHLYPLEIEPELDSSNLVESIAKQNPTDSQVTNEKETPNQPKLELRRSQRKLKPLRHSEFVYTMDDSEEESEMANTWTAITKPHGRKSFAIKNLLCIILLLLANISSTVTQTTQLNSTLVSVTDVSQPFNKTTPLPKRKVHYHPRRKYIRYRIKSRINADEPNIPTSSTMITTVRTTSKPTFRTTNLTPTSTKASFRVDRPHSVNTNIGQSRIFMKIPISTKPNVWSTTTSTHMPFTISSQLNSPVRLNTSVNSFSTIKSIPVLKDHWSKIVPRTRPVARTNTYVAANATNVTKTALVEPETKANRSNYSINLMKDVLLTPRINSSFRETKRRDLTRPVYIPGQTYHPDQLQKIAFGDPKISQKFYFCKEKGSTFWRIPDEEPLRHELHRLLRPWKQGTVTIFSKTVEPKRIRASHLCAKKFESIRYYTNLLGDRFSEIKIEMRPVAPSECKDFLKYKSCNEGTLIRNNNDLFTTNKVLKVEFPGAFAGFFRGAQYDEVTNCLLEETTAFYKPNSYDMFSPLYDLKHCKYAEGNCIVNNMTLVWYPECTKCQKCYYSKIRKVTGTYSKNRFLSDDKEYGKSLSMRFTDNPPAILSCEGMHIRVSNQGLAVLDEDFQMLTSGENSGYRSKRETATTEELASELTAAELKLTRLVEHLFEIQCRSTAKESNPTLMARALLKREDVIAKWRSRRILEVFPCATIKSGAIRLRAVQDKCFKFIPVTVEVPQLGWINAFIDPFLSIISATSIETDCRTSQQHVIELDNDLLLFDAILNKTSKISPLDIHELPPGLGISEQSYLEVEAFQDLILSNETEEFEKAYHAVHVDELDRTSHWKDATEIKKTSKTEALSATPHTLPGVIESYFFGWLGIFHDIWLNVCGILVTLYTLALLVYCCLPMGLAQPLQNVQRRIARMRFRREMGRHIANRPSPSVQVDPHRPSSDSSERQSEVHCELKPIIRRETPKSIKMRDRRQYEPTVRYSKSVYEPTTETEPLINLQKSVSSDHMVIRAKNMSSPINIQSAKKQPFVVPSSPRLENAQSWSQLFKPSLETRPTESSSIEPIPGTSNVISPDSFENVSMESLNERYGKSVRITKPTIKRSK